MYSTVQYVLWKCSKQNKAQLEGSIWNCKRGSFGAERNGAALRRCGVQLRGAGHGEAEQKAREEKPGVGRRESARDAEQHNERVAELQREAAARAVEQPAPRRAAQCHAQSLALEHTAQHSTARTLQSSDFKFLNGVCSQFKYCTRTCAYCIHFCKILYCTVPTCICTVHLMFCVASVLVRRKNMRAQTHYFHELTQYSRVQ